MMRGWSLTDGNSSGGSGEVEELECRDRNSEARLFCISVDVRSFKANMHLPMRSANVFVRVALPPEIVRVAVESCAMSSKVTAPLRTHPPVLVSRGTEVSISNGYVALDLPASPDGMAAMLALQPAVTAHVLHRDKYAADSVLGVATIPMKRLIDQPCADGYAPVHGATNVAGKIDDVKIGALRVVLAIEDMGPLSALDASKVKTAAASQDHVRQPMPEDPAVSKLMTGYIFGSGGSSCAEQGEVQGENTSEETELGEVPKISSKSSTPFNKKRKNSLRKKKISSPVKTPPLSSDVHESVKQSDVNGVDGVRKQPEYEMAWEFEMWRRSEEAKWRADLKEKEAAKLHAIEEEWRKRERERALQLRNSQSEQADLEAKLRAKLFILEKRERAIILSEEDLSHHKEVLERANTNRSSEAQIAVKRLQAECEHRVDLERSKYVALQEQYSVLEQRLVTANCSLATLEKQFQDFKAAQRNTSETALIGQVMALKQQCGTLQHKADLALHARDDYKNQVLKMAKELARLHREHMKSQVHQATQERSRVESETVAALVESQSRKAREDRLELQRLKDQLDLLQLREQESMTVTATKQQSGHISPRKVESMSLPDRSLLSLRKTNVPKLDLSKAQDEKDGTAHTDLRIFQEMRNKLKYDKANPISWSRQPLTEMGQKQKEPVMSGTKGAISNVETRYHDLRSADLKNEDSALHDLDSAAEASRSKVEYLLKQRGELLKTGVYNEKDRVIKGLDQEIQQLKFGNRDLNPYKNPTMSP